jgi:hypothetical protein
MPLLVLHAPAEFRSDDGAEITPPSGLKSAAVISQATEIVGISDTPVAGTTAAPMTATAMTTRVAVPAIVNGGGNIDADVRAATIAAPIMPTPVIAATIASVANFLNKTQPRVAGGLLLKAEGLLGGNDRRG